MGVPPGFPECCWGHGIFNQVWNVVHQGMGLFHHKHKPHVPSFIWHLSSFSALPGSQVRHVVCVELGTQAFLAAFLRNCPLSTQVNTKWSNTTRTAWIQKLECTKKCVYLKGGRSWHGKSGVLHWPLASIPDGGPGYWWTSPGTQQPCRGDHSCH